LRGRRLRWRVDNVTKLPTDLVKFRDSIDTMVDDLVKDRDDGRIRELIVLYFDLDGTPFHMVSKSLTISNFSYAVHMLTRRLFRWFDD